MPMAKWTVDVLYYKKPRIKGKNSYQPPRFSPWFHNIPFQAYPTGRSIVRTLPDNQDVKTKYKTRKTATRMSAVPHVHPVSRTEEECSDR